MKEVKIAAVDSAVHPLDGAVGASEVVGALGQAVDHVALQVHVRAVRIRIASGGQS